MKKKIRDNYQTLAQGLGLRLNEECGAIFGERGGFTVLIEPIDKSRPYQLSVNISAHREGAPLSKEELKELSKQHKPLMNVVLKDHRFTANLKACPNQEKLRESLDEVLNALTSCLRGNGYENCCQTCGRVGEVSACSAGGGQLLLCDDCFTTMSQNTALSEENKKHKKENVIGGVIGALLGSLLGVLCIIVLSQLGYVAALSGLVMAICTLKGYELLGGKLTVRGIVLCSVIMLVMTYIGDRLDWAITIMRELEADFVAAYQVFPMLLSEGYLDSTSYWLNLGLVYVFLLLGAVPTVRSALADQKNENRMFRL